VYRKKFHLIAGVIVLVSSCYASASPEGAYVFIGGGGAYLPKSNLSNVTITRTLLDPFTANYAINYQLKNSFDYTGRLAFGYFFNHDYTKNHAFGLEAGFNYFGPIKNSINSQLVVAPINKSFPVSSSINTTTWSTDLAGVYSHDIVNWRTSFLVKLGLGYEHMRQKITNTGVGLPGALPASVVNKNTGLGVVGGVGLQYNITHSVAMRIEFDGLKGERNVGYAQSLVGLTWSFS